MKLAACASMSVGLAALVAGFSPEAHAQSAASAPPAPIEVVVTGTRTPENSQRSTVRTEVITRAEAERRGATNVGEALSGQLGVQVNPSAYGFLGNPSAIQIQGFDRERVLVLENGERVIGDVGGAIDLASIPLTDVSRIELVTGPTSSLYGASAIGGVINILTAAPDAPGPSGRVRFEARSRPGVVLQGLGAYRSGDTWASIDASHQRSAGIALDERVPDLTLPATSQTLVGARAGAKVGERITLQARGRWIHNASEGLTEERVPGLGAYLIDLPSSADRFTLHLMQTIDLGGGSNLRMTLGKQWANAETVKDRRDSIADERRARQGEMQSFESVVTVADGPTRTWVAGARFEVERYAQESSRAQLSTGGVQFEDLHEVPQTMLGSAAVYGQLAWKPWTWLTVLPGLRGEMHLRYGGVAAPRLAVAVKPSPRWVLRASLGRGFRAPGAKELGFVFDHSFYGYRVLGNSNLSPETSWGLNGDIAFMPQRGLTLRAGGFANWIDQLIDIDLNPAATTGAVVDYRYRNVAKARTAGAQVDLVWQIEEHFRAEAGYAYLWTRDDTHERPLEGRPPHTVYASIRAALPYKLGLYARFRAVTDAFVDEALRSPGFQTLDARVSRELWPGAEAYIGVLNALDAKKDPTRPGDQRPLAGRTLYLGITAEYPWES